MFERSFEWLKAKVGVSDEQVVAWEDEAKNEVKEAARAKVEAARQALDAAVTELEALAPVAEQAPEEQQAA